MFAPPQLAALVAALNGWIANASVDESAMVVIASPPPNFEVVLFLTLAIRILPLTYTPATQPAIVVVPFFNGSAEEGKKRFQLVYNVGPIADMTREMPYEELNGTLVHFPVRACTVYAYELSLFLEPYGYIRRQENVQSSRTVDA